jgi:hypothetical protein
MSQTYFPFYKENLSLRKILEARGYKYNEEKLSQGPDYFARQFDELLTTDSPNKFYFASTLAIQREVFWELTDGIEDIDGVEIVRFSAHTGPLAGFGGLYLRYDGKFLGQLPGGFVS